MQKNKLELIIYKWYKIFFIIILSHAMKNWHVLFMVYLLFAKWVILYNIYWKWSRNVKYLYYRFSYNIWNVFNYKPNLNYSLTIDKTEPNKNIYSNKISISFSLAYTWTIFWMLTLFLAKLWNFNRLII